jgi:hypothetical protein
VLLKLQIGAVSSMRAHDEHYGDCIASRQVARSVPRAASGRHAWHRVPLPGRIMCRAGSCPSSSGPTRRTPRGSAGARQPMSDRSGRGATIAAMQRGSPETAIRPCRKSRGGDRSARKQQQPRDEHRHRSSAAAAWGNEPGADGARGY